MFLLDIFILITIDPKRFPFSQQNKMKLFFKVLKGFSMIRILEEIANQSYRRSYKGALHSHCLTTVP